jgi:hypothetical protein
LYPQIVPSVLPRLLRDKDAEKSQRVMKAMLGMVKLDIEGLKQAAAAGSERKAGGRARRSKGKKSPRHRPDPATRSSSARGARRLGGRWALLSLEHASPVRALARVLWEPTESGGAARRETLRNGFEVDGVLVDAMRSTLLRRR